MPIIDILEAKLPPFDKISIDRLPLVIKEKVYLIGKLIDEAIILLKAKETFPTEIPKFDSHISMLQGLENNLTEYLKIVYECIEDPDMFFRVLKRANERLKQEDIINEKSLFSIINDKDPLSYNDSIKLMGMPEYEPDTALSNNIEMLFYLFNYWLIWPLSRGTFVAEENEKEIGIDVLMGNFIQDAERALDLSLAKLSYQIGVETAQIRQWGRRERDRTVKSTQKHKEKREKDHHAIYRAFYEEEFKRGTNLNQVVTHIWKVTGEKLHKTTIRKILRENEDIFKYFKPEIIKGRKYLIYQP